MKIIFALALSLTCVSILNAASAKQTQQLTFSTQAPTLLEDNPPRLMTVQEDEYRTMAERYSRNPRIVFIKQKPVRLSAHALYGLNLNFGGFNRSWILDRDKKQGYILYADLNANGDLRDDRPLKFEKKDDQFSLVYKTTISEIVNGTKESYPLWLKLVLDFETSPESISSQIFIRCYQKTVRTGKLHLNGRKVMFNLVGDGGQYQNDNDLIFFDTNGDEQLDLGNPKSAERYWVSEKFVNIGDASYEFIVDRYGRSLTLKPLSEKLPERAVLTPGSLAPEFSFKDTSGKTHRLSDYRQRVVLLNFWTTKCPFCVSEAPKLTAAYNRLREKGFEIISINRDNELSEVQKFASVHEMNWIQVRDERPDLLYNMFRVRQTPTYFVINVNGTILADGHRIEKLIGEIEKQLEK